MLWDLVARIIAWLLHDFLFLHAPGPGKRRVSRIHKERP